MNDNSDVMAGFITYLAICNGAPFKFKKRSFNNFNQYKLHKCNEVELNDKLLLNGLTITDNIVNIVSCIDKPFKLSNREYFESLENYKSIIIYEMTNKDS